MFDQIAAVDGALAKASDLRRTDADPGRKNLWTSVAAFQKTAVNVYATNMDFQSVQPAELHSAGNGASEVKRLALSKVRTDPTRIFLTALLVACASMCVAAPPRERTDYAPIEQLPGRLHEQIAKADNIPEGNTSAQAKNMEQCNKALLQMIYDLGARYYETKVPSRQAIDKYGQNLYAIHQFRQSIAGSSGQRSREEASLDVSNEVYKDLLVTVEEMVVAITQKDRQFDYQRWKNRWERAKLSDIGM